MAAVFGPPTPRLSRSVVLNDPFDEEAFADILPRAPGLRLLLETLPAPETRDLAFDLFCSFYKYVVKLRPADAVVPERRAHRDLVGRALGLREHEKLRAWTKLKPAETALATELVLDLLVNRPQPEAPKPEEQSKSTEPDAEPEAHE